MLELLLKRKSIRSYTGDSISKEDLNLPIDFIPCCAVSIGKTNETFEEKEIPNRIEKKYID